MITSARSDEKQHEHRALITEYMPDVRVWIERCTNSKNITNNRIHLADFSATKF